MQRHSFYLLNFNKLVSFEDCLQQFLQYKSNRVNATGNMTCLLKAFSPKVAEDLSEDINYFRQKVDGKELLTWRSF